MEAESVINKNACRLCDKNANKMFSVFGKNEAGQQLIQLIKDYLPVIIYRTDPLSKQICENCYCNLNTYVGFHKIITETTNRQKEILKECTVKDKSTQLYLSSLDLKNVPTNGITQCEVKNDKTVLCSKCRSSVIDGSDEIEMCAELHRAIANSLKKPDETRNSSRMSNLRNKRKRNEGFYTEIDDYSQESYSVHSEYSESTQRTEESQSDTEMGYSDQEFPLRLTNTRKNVCHSPVLKKRCIAGPKSRFGYVRKHNEKFSFFKALQYEPDIQYNPLSLLQTALNVINRENVSDYFCEPFKRSIAYSECKRCGEKFKNVKLLALHDMSHMNIGVEKVDDCRVWSGDCEDAEIRNKWYEEFKEQKKIDDEKRAEQSLLVPVKKTKMPFKSEIVLIDTKAYVNGVLLNHIPKDDRRMLYRNITIQGLKRKFCPLCRYTFKDNWAIESHYYSSACYYTCRYCGIRFNKQRVQFEEHVRKHVKSGHKPSLNIYAPRKSNGTIPKILNESKLTNLPKGSNTVSAPKVKPVQVKPVQVKQSVKKPVEEEVKIKQERVDSPVTPAPSNQAYFCRKCYQVFYELDKFNTHVSSCKGGNSSCESKPKVRRNNVVNQTPVNNKVNNVKNECERYSLSGRPVRHCVKEVTYRDEIDIDAALEMCTPNSKFGHSEKDGPPYKCVLCGCCFPSVHSRNSHMRIHKNGVRLDAVSVKSHNIIRQRPENYAKKVLENITRDTTYNNFDPNIKIKQEPGEEPIPEIKEEVTLHKIPSSIGSVSITPIPSKKGTSINPNIMKLVQNNPHLTIKSMSSNTYTNTSNNSAESVSSAASSSSNSVNDQDKLWKCSSCGKGFMNKSHLYFHKKNQCSGSKYPCPFCKKRFGTETAYSSHIFYSHPE